MLDEMNLDQYRKCFNATEEQFIALHDVEESCINTNRAYEKIADVTCIALGDDQYFFFKDGRLKLIYISDETITKKIWDEFNSVPDKPEPEEIVRSRAGKTSNQKVFASHGITASITRGEVDFLELYPSCTVQDYLDNIYREPPAFIR